MRGLVGFLHLGAGFVFISYMSDLANRHVKFSTTEIAIVAFLLWQWVMLALLLGPREIKE